MHPLLETRDLLLVRAIAREGGVSPAARRLHLSQSAVSHHLSRLEERLGVALFDRQGRRLALAKAGERVLALGDEVLPKMAAVEKELRATKQHSVRLATQCYTAYQWLPAITSILAEEHPNVSLSIRLGATRDPIAALEDDKLDLALVHSGAASRRFSTSVIGEDKLLLVMAATHPLALKKKVRPSDLAEHTFYVFDASNQVLRTQAAMTFPKGDAPKKIARIPLTEALIELIRAGQGVSLVSRWIATRYIERGDLVARPLSGANCNRKWRAVHRRTGPLLPALKTITHFLQKRDPLA